MAESAEVCPETNLTDSTSPAAEITNSTSGSGCEPPVSRALAAARGLASRGGTTSGSPAEKTGPGASPGDGAAGGTAPGPGAAAKGSDPPLNGVFASWNGGIAGARAPPSSVMFWPSSGALGGAASARTSTRGSGCGGRDRNLQFAASTPRLTVWITCSTSSPGGLRQLLNTRPQPPPFRPRPCPYGCGCRQAPERQQGSRPKRSCVSTIDGAALAAVAPAAQVARQARLLQQRTGAGTARTPPGRSTAGRGARRTRARDADPASEFSLGRGDTSSRTSSRSCIGSWSSGVSARSTRPALCTGECPPGPSASSVTRPSPVSAMCFSSGTRRSSAGPRASTVSQSSWTMATLSNHARRVLAASTSASVTRSWVMCRACAAPGSTAGLGATTDAESAAWVASATGRASAAGLMLAVSRNATTSPGTSSWRSMKPSAASITANAFIEPAMRQGLTPRHVFVMVPSRDTNTRSIGTRIEKVWTALHGAMIIA